MESFELDDGGTTTLPLPMARPVAMWPIYAVLGLSVLSIIAVAILRAFVPALIGYALLMVAGCGLLFYRRTMMIAETRRAGGFGFVALSRWDRIALLVLVAACLANGLVIALEMASWDWGQ